MKTIVVTLDKEHPDGEAILRAGEIIKAGGLVAFPTETVYGLGGDALNPESSRKIYAAKGRPSDNPLIVHICRWEDIYKIADPVPEIAERLAARFWPGPLTMILNKTALVPKETTGGLDTVAVRFPSDSIAQRFICAAGGFVAAPSANTSGRPSPTLAQYVKEDMDGRIEMILDGGEEVGIGLESTIVDLTGDIPMILRPGYVTQKMLEEVANQVDVDKTILDANCHLRPKAPGMRYRHYAPKGELTIVLPKYPANQKLRAEIIYKSPLKPPVRKGDQVAVLRVTSSSNAQNEVPLYAAEDVGAAGMMRKGLDSLVHLAFRWITL